MRRSPTRAAESRASRAPSLPFGQGAGLGTSAGSSAGLQGKPAIGSGMRRARSLALPQEVQRGCRASPRLVPGCAGRGGWNFRRRFGGVARQARDWFREAQGAGVGTSAGSLAGLQGKPAIGSGERRARMPLPPFADGLTNMRKPYPRGGKPGK